MQEPQKVPPKLKRSMTLHVLNDLVLCGSLFLFPEHFIEFSGWRNFDPFALRLIAAGLSAVAIELYLKRNSSLEVYTSLFNVKLATLGIAALGTIISIYQNINATIVAEWVLLVGTGVPFLQMSYWKIQLNKIKTE